MWGGVTVHTFIHILFISCNTEETACVLLRCSKVSSHSPLTAQVVYCVPGCYGHVVVEAEAMWAVGLGVVARWTYHPYAGPRPAVPHLLHHLKLTHITKCTLPLFLLLLALFLLFSITVFFIMPVSPYSLTLHTPLPIHFLSFSSSTNSSSLTSSAILNITQNHKHLNPYPQNPLAEASMANNCSLSCSPLFHPNVTSLHNYICIKSVICP